MISSKGDKMEAPGRDYNERDMGNVIDKVYDGELELGEGALELQYLAAQMTKLEEGKLGEKVDEPLEMVVYSPTEDEYEAVTVDKSEWEELLEKPMDSLRDLDQV